ncbi:protein kinase [bacterium]|nr:protein kinase [bacterium]
MICSQCGKSFADELGSCPYCSTLPKKIEQKLGADFISRLFAGDLPSGTPFGDRYQIEELVGRGGMGIVYRSKDNILHETVAIKLLNPLFSSDKEIVVRFKQEIKLARKINHKNVIHIYDIGEVDGIRYISMEYVQGKDLKEVIRAEGGGLPLNVGIMIIQKIAEALQVAHDLDIIHRDIKPQNILIQPNGDVKILDFGIARLSDSDDLSKTGSLLGSPVYMSPEQASGKDTDRRTDIYSLGVIMFEMFTGRIPFLADTPIATALKHVNETPPLPSSLNPDIPVWVEKVILKAMEKDPANRFQKVIDIIDPVHGLHISRITDTDIVVCAQCGKHNPASNSSCSNCQSFLIKEAPSEQSLPVQTLPVLEVQAEERRLMRLATAAFERHDLQQAKDHLEHLLSITPENVKAQRMLEVIDSKIRLEKKINLYHQNALISFQDKKYDDALALWEKIIQLDPDRTEWNDFLVKARDAQGMYNRIKGFISKGLQAYNQNDYQEAISYWEKVIEIDPRNPEAVFYISKTQVLLDSENRYLNLQNQAEIFIKHHEYSKAIECYEQLLKLDPENIALQIKLDELRETETINNLLAEGLALYNHHEYEQAITCWRKISDLDQDNKDAHNYIIQAEARINELIKVKEIFRIGLVHFKDKQWKNAIAQFEDVRKFEGPYQKDALAFILKSQQQLEKESRIEKLLKEGLLIYQQEHHDPSRKIWGASAAIKEWEKVLEIEPDHAEALDYIAKAKLIIQRSKMLAESKKTEGVVPTIISTQAAESLLKAGQKAKLKKQRKKIAVIRDIQEYVVGAIIGGAIGDALGLGNSWVVRRSDDIEDITHYVANTIGHFRNIQPGQISGDLELVLKTMLLLFQGDTLKASNVLHTMIKQKKKIASPLEKSTDTLLNNLRKGVAWKDAVLVEEDDFSPLYRSALMATLTFHDQEKMVRNIKTLVMMTHRNKKVLACSMAVAFALASILEYRNTTLKGASAMIGGDTVPIPLWDNTSFIKSISEHVEDYDLETADQIRELLIYSSMPSERFFDTVGISDKAQETLLASLFCFLKHHDNFSEAVILAVNSRGSSKHVTGNRHGIAGLTGFMTGAYNGFVQIPFAWINDLLDHNQVFETATSLFTTCIAAR